MNRVVFPSSLKKIGSQAFLKTQLENVIFPVSVEEIGPEAFREAVSLKSITLPNNIQKIGWQAFYGCTKLANVNYAGSMKSAEGVVESAAFEGCEALTRVILPQSISEIQEGIFMECNKLTQIILPENVKKIGGYGLRTNYPVKKIVFKSGKAPEVEDTSLPFVDDLTSIVVPKGKLEEYKAAYADYQKIMTENP